MGLWNNSDGVVLIWGRTMAWFEWGTGKTCDELDLIYMEKVMEELREGTREGGRKEGKRMEGRKAKNTSCVVSCRFRGPV